MFILLNYNNIKCRKTHVALSASQLRAILSPHRRAKVHIFTVTLLTKKTLKYPSRYEGFGIPVVEGLESMRPVVAATGSCLEEAGGPESLYVDPDSPRDMAAALIAALRGVHTRQIFEVKTRIIMYTSRHTQLSGYAVHGLPVTVMVTPHNHQTYIHRKRGERTHGKFKILSALDCADLQDIPLRQTKTGAQRGDFISTP